MTREIIDVGRKSLIRKVSVDLVPFEGGIPKVVFFTRNELSSDVIFENQSIVHVRRLRGTRL